VRHPVLVKSKITNVMNVYRSYFGKPGTPYYSKIKDLSEKFRKNCQNVYSHPFLKFKQTVRRIDGYLFAVDIDIYADAFGEGYQILAIIVLNDQDLGSACPHKPFHVAKFRPAGRHHGTAFELPIKELTVVQFYGVGFVDA